MLTLVRLVGASKLVFAGKKRRFISMEIVDFRPVNADNWKHICDLQSTPAQRIYTRPNLDVLLERRYTSAQEHWAIYHQDQLVGYIAISRQENNALGAPAYWIKHLMIDAQHQQRGYAKAALFLLKRLTTLWLYDYYAQALYLAYTPENEAARRSSISQGFVETGEIDPDGRVIARCALKQPQQMIVKTIGAEDWRACADLRPPDSVVSPSVTEYLLQAHYEPERAWKPSGIYQAGVLVGFVMYSDAITANGYLWLQHLMIDQRYPQQAYAQQALEWVIGRLRIHAIPDDRPDGLKGIAARFARQNHFLEQLYLANNFTLSDNPTVNQRVAVMPL
jgi:diamine N-acetyltransferase